MVSRTGRLIQGAIAMLAALAMASCGNQKAAEERHQPPVADITDMAWTWADSVCESMDTSQMAAQLIMPAVYARNDEATLRQIGDYGRMGMGGVVLLKGSAAGARAISDTLNTVSPVLPFIAIDAEWGLGMRLEDTPLFPANSTLREGVDEQLMYSYGREIARECRLTGINVVLGPVVDVGYGNRFLGRRCYRGDAARVSLLGLAYGRGLRDGNIMPVAKHFPGHGTVNQDSHKGKGVIAGSLQHLDSVDLVPFRAWSDAMMPAVMVGHLAVPSIDSEMLPAAVSPVVIGDLLRGDLRFEGLVFTDAMNMSGAEGRSAASAVAAGADVVLAPLDTEKEIACMVNAVRDGSLPLRHLKDRVVRVLFHKYLMQGGALEKGAVRTAVTDSIINALRQETNSNRR